MIAAPLTGANFPSAATLAVTGNSQENATGSAKELGKNEFLQLMIAQLKNQDPMDPVKNEAYIAQLATFSSLEQLIAIKDGINKLTEIQTGQNTTG
jgi:flagellar basal-body rod modification protein FlgD